MTRAAFCPACGATQPLTDELWCKACGGPMEESAAPAPDAPPLTILCIDDDRLLLSLCCDALEREGYRTLIATDGLSGIETARAARPDLILLDVIMPEMDGLETCRRLRAVPALRTTPIVLLTASPDLKLDAEGRAAGATLTLRKPFGPGLIVSSIRQILERGEPPIRGDRAPC
ncbi:MAG: response regulator [Candidatus Methylomirabilales bacterium]